jgi:hypothetical protein
MPKLTLTRDPTIFEIAMYCVLVVEVSSAEPITFTLRKTSTPVAIIMSAGNVAKGKFSSGIAKMIAAESRHSTVVRVKEDQK